MLLHFLFLFFLFHLVSVFIIYWSGTISRYQKFFFRRGFFFYFALKRSRADIGYPSRESDVTCFDFYKTRKQNRLSNASMVKILYVGDYFVRLFFIYYDDVRISEYLLILTWYCGFIPVP